MTYQFLFGQTVRPTQPSSNVACPLLILGAYPSALHVRWISPEGQTLIKAVAVDNEPTPFWDGSGEEDLIAQWSKDVGFRPEWGSVGCCGRLNGSSGGWVNDHVLVPLGIPRNRAWITDCLDMYCESKGAATKLGPKGILSDIKRLGVPPAHHLAHPSESEIVRLAHSDHASRLLTEIRQAQPDLIVTLGNAALRVLGRLAYPGGEQIRPLRHDDSYGKELRLVIAGREIRWLPLAHPAAPARFRTAHAAWERGLGFGRNQERAD